MKSLKGALSHIVLTILFVLSIVLFATQALAETVDEDNDGKIEVIYAPQILAPYKERQSNWGIVGGVNYSEFYPDKFRSRIGNFTYDQIFDSYPMDMIQGEVGLKYNTSIGSLGVGMAVGMASAQGNARIQNVKTGGPRELKITKYALTGTYTLDTLFSEPYVAPYVSGQVFKLDWEETETILKQTQSGTTAFSFGVTAGLLIQINWLDSDAALTAQTSSGLNNTFLDLFVTQYNTSNDAADPNFETEMNVGGGIKLEF